MANGTFTTELWFAVHCVSQRTDARPDGTASRFPFLAASAAFGAKLVAPMRSMQRKTLGFPTPAERFSECVALTD